MIFFLKGAAYRRDNFLDVFLAPAACRLMCGKPPAFRPTAFFILLLGEAQPRRGEI
jgi:hypothetical protein